MAAEHTSFGGAAVNLFSIRQKAVKTADHVTHFVQGMEGAGHASEGHVTIIVEPAVCQQRLMGL